MPRISDLGTGQPDNQNQSNQQTPETGPQYTAGGGFNFIDTIRRSKTPPNLGEEGDAYIKAIKEELPKRLPGAEFIRLEDSGVYAAIYEHFVIYVMMYVASSNSAKLNQEHRIGFNTFETNTRRFRLPVATLEKPAHSEATDYYRSNIAPKLEKKFANTSRPTPNDLDRCGNIVITEDDYGRVEQMINFLAKNLHNQSDVANRGPVCGFEMIARSNQATRPEDRSQLHCESNPAALEQMIAANSPQVTRDRADLNAVLTIRQRNQDDVDLAAVTAYVEVVPDQLPMPNSPGQFVNGYRPIIRITNVHIPSGEMGLFGLAITCALPVLATQVQGYFEKNFQKKNLGLLIPNPTTGEYEPCKTAAHVKSLYNSGFISSPGYAFDMTYGRALPSIAYRIALTSQVGTEQVLSFAGLQFGGASLFATESYEDFNGDFIVNGNRTDTRNLDIFYFAQDASIEQAKYMVSRAGSAIDRNEAVSELIGDTYRCMYVSKVHVLNAHLIESIRRAIESAGIRIFTHTTSNDSRGVSYSSFIPNNGVGATIGAPMGGTYGSAFSFNTNF